MDTPTEWPAEVEEAYQIWRDLAGRNVAETSRLLERRNATVHDWFHKYGFRQRAEVEDVEGRDRAIRVAYQRMREAVPGFTQTAILATRCRRGRDGVEYALAEDGVTRLDCPTPAATKAAFTGLATFGVAPIRSTELTVTSQSTASITTEDLAALADAGDIDALLDITLGRYRPKPLPSGDAPPPQDFMRNQQDGRAGRDPASPRTEPIDAAFHPAS